MSALLFLIANSRPIPTPIPEPEPEPEIPAGTALTLSMTGEELEIIRDRAVNGPYRIKGDRFTNSPGDWVRILADASVLKTNNIIDRYSGPTGSIPYNAASTPIPHSEGKRIINCAFVGVVMQDLSYVNAAKNALLDTIFENISNLQYRVNIEPPAWNGSGSNARWKYDSFADSGYLFIATEWLIRLFNAYDLLKNYFTSSEQKAAIELWFKNWAYFAARETNKIYVELWGPNRYNDTWVVQPTAPSNLSDTAGRKTHDEGYAVPRIAIFYNNRRTTKVNFFAQVGLFLNDSFLIDSAKAFFKEVIRYGVFPNGMLSDMQRGTLSTGSVAHETGISYCAGQLGILIQIADVFARKGDMSLYNYTTSAGLYGTQGGPKNLKLVMDLYSSIYRKKVEYYYNGELLDGERPNWKSILDAQMSRANIFYRSEDIKKTYMRVEGNPFPSSPASIGGNPAEMGNGTNTPGLAIQYFEMEGEVWPYPNE